MTINPLETVDFYDKFHTLICFMVHTLLSVTREHFFASELLENLKPHTIVSPVYYLSVFSYET